MMLLTLLLSFDGSGGGPSGSAPVVTRGDHDSGRRSPVRRDRHAAVS